MAQFFANVFEYRDNLSRSLYVWLFSAVRTLSLTESKTEIERRGLLDAGLDEEVYRDDDDDNFFGFTLDAERHLLSRRYVSCYILGEADSDVDSFGGDSSLTVSSL